MENYIEDKRPRLGICFNCDDSFPFEELYGHSLCRISKTCDCDLDLMCLDCLKHNIATDVRGKIIPQCPGRTGGHRNTKRCERKFGPEVVPSLFHSECLLCFPNINSQSMIDLEHVGHSFCRSCIKESVVNDITVRTIPKCPRFSECKYRFMNTEIELLDNILSGFPEDRKESLISLYHDNCIQFIYNQHSMTKKCPKADCTGYLMGPRDQLERHLSFESKCTSCHISYCFSCCSLFHYNRTCVAAANVSARWRSFLDRISRESSGKSGGISSALLKMQQAADTATYFRERIKHGLLKRCPKCNRMIEKLGGCDHMICGENGDGGNTQNGCGYSMSWTDVPTPPVTAFEEVTVVEDADLDFSHMQVDLSTVSADSPPRFVQCCQCNQSIRGTRFDCVNCPSPVKSMCIACVRIHIDSATSVHGSHLFDLIAPAPAPRPAISCICIEISKEGEISTFGLKSAVSSLLITSTVGETAKMKSMSPYNDIVVVRIDVRADGKIVFSDSANRACGWIALDSIMFKLKGRGTRIPLSVPSGIDSDSLFIPEDGEFPPSLVKNEFFASIVYGRLMLVGKPSPEINTSRVLRLGGAHVRFESVCFPGFALSSSRYNHDSRRKVVFAVNRREEISRLGRYVVVADQGVLVRRAMEMNSDDLKLLPVGEFCDIVEVVGQRARIASPVDGWLSLQSSDGQLLLRNIRSEMAEETADSRQEDVLDIWEVIAVQTENETKSSQVYLRNSKTRRYLYATGEDITNHSLKHEDQQNLNRPVYVWNEDKNADIMSKAIFEVEAVSGETNQIRLRSVYHVGMPYLYISDKEKKYGNLSVNIWVGEINETILSLSRFNVDVTDPSFSQRVQVHVKDTVCQLDNDTIPSSTKTVMGMLITGETPQPIMLSRESSLAESEKSKGMSADNRKSTKSLAGDVDSTLSIECPEIARAESMETPRAEDHRLKSFGYPPSDLPSCILALNQISFKFGDEQCGRQILNLSHDVTPVGGNQEAVGYVIDGDLVRFFGMIESKFNPGQKIAKLPDSLRPTKNCLFLAYADNGSATGNKGPCILELDTKGRLIWQEMCVSEIEDYYSSDYIVRRVSLEGIRFKITDDNLSEFHIGRHVTDQSFYSPDGFKSAKMFVEKSCCFLQGRLFKVKKTPVRSSLTNDNRPLSPPRDRNRPPFGFAWNQVDIRQNRINDDELINPLRAPSGISELWSPGDVLARLPEGYRPTTTCSFACLASAAPAWPREPVLSDDQSENAQWRMPPNNFGRIQQQQQNRRGGRGRIDRDRPRQFIGMNNRGRGGW